MKTSYLSFFVLMVLFISGCNGKKTAEVLNASPNQKVKVAVTAKRPNVLDPWKVEIKVKAYDFKEGELLFELYASDLTDQTVKFTWQDDSHCLITIEQREGDPRKFQLIADANQVQLAEI